MPVWPRLALATVTGLAVGTVLDEWYYYMATEVTDEAYFEVETWATALGLAVVLGCTWSAWVFHRQRLED